MYRCGDTWSRRGMQRVCEVKFGDRRLSRHGDVLSEEQLSGEAAPHLSEIEAPPVGKR
jgi:hypothetical protein